MKMIYSKFGNTGKQISKLGFGAARLPEYKIGNSWHLDRETVNNMVMTAIDLGINSFDSGDLYCHGLSELAIAESLSHNGRRNSVYLANKVMPASLNSENTFRKNLENQLMKLNQDHFDFYYFWGIGKDDFDNMTKYGYIEDAKRAKKDGLIDHIGFSFHDSADAMKYIIDKCNAFEMVLCQYNILDRTNEEQMAYAKEHGLGVLVMSPLAGGRLVNPHKMLHNDWSDLDALSIEIAMRFVLSNKSVDCTLSGFSDINMVKENVGYISQCSAMSQEELDRVSAMVSQLSKFSDLYCTGCNYCQPCAMGIDISRYFNAYTLSNVYRLNKSAFDDFLAMQRESDFIGAEKCIQCYKCVERCPQKIDIPKKLVKVDRYLNKLVRFYDFMKKLDDNQEG